MFILHKKRKAHHPHPCLPSPLSSPLPSVPSSCSTSSTSLCSLHHNHAKCPSNCQTVNFVINSKFTFQFPWINLSTAILWIYLVLCTLTFRTSYAIPSTPSDRSQFYTRDMLIGFPVCRQLKSQCSSRQESDYYQEGGFKLDTILGDPMRRVSTDFNDYTRKFDGLIKDLIKQSENQFHTMFIKTYGRIYEKHAKIFKNMFTLLTKYYTNTNVNLDSEFTEFFTDLYVKIFLELNSQYTFSDEYQKCVALQMETVNPFGDIPRKLIIEVQRSFTAARVFIQSLITASEISRTIAETPVTRNCHKFFVQMRYCQQCASEGDRDRLPCREYCNAVMNTCTASYRTLNRDWNPFLDKLTAIINRLETSFNIESVVGPLDIKISEAIMVFQENGMTVSKRLFSTCGKPKRGKRMANRRLSEAPTSLDNRSPQPSKTPLEIFLDGTKKELKKLKDFWQRLPETVCNNSIIPATLDGSELNNKPCWSHQDGSTEPLSDKTPALIEKVEFINTQRALLRNVNSKLDAAFRGSDVPEDEDSSGSGSGSGDGDYDEEYPDEYGDDEDEDDPVPKSSTSSPVSSVIPILNVTENSNSSMNGEDKPSETKADNVTNDLSNEIELRLRNPPKGSSSLIERSSLMIVSLTLASILIGQNL